MDGHRRLIIWQRAGELVAAVYRLSAQLPGDEKFIAVQQIRRAAWSVQNNIAEGYAKRGRPEMRRFFDTAAASLAEVDSMVATLSQLYALDTAMVAKISDLRRRINAGIFKMLRQGR